MILGNDFFSLWLDDTLTYSSAIFDDKTKNLSDAQNNKYQKLIDLIKPNNGDKSFRNRMRLGRFC